MKLLDYSTLEKFDPQGMHKIYDSWPEISEESYSMSLKTFTFDNVDHIIFAGMGGSGTIGDVFSSILSQTKIHVRVVKGYLLPKTVDSNTLVVITSISGNTSESLAIIKSAKNLGCKIIAFSSGGKIEKYCTENNLLYVKIPMIHSPRASFPKFLYIMLKVLEPILPIKKEDITNSITQMKNLKQKISSSNLSDDNISLDLAKWISGIPLIYFPAGLKAAAIRFKNSIQENTKIHAMAEDVIETCHNGIVSWETNTNVVPILIEGADDHFKTKERWDILKEYFRTNNIDYKEIFSVKGNILSKLINLIYLLDYSSIYLAVLSGVDPTPISSINFVKERLAD